MKYEFKNGLLTINERQILVLQDGYVSKVQEVADLLLVFFEHNDSRDTPDDNVFAYDSHGNLVWRVEAFNICGHRDAMTISRRRETANPYSYMYPMSDGSLQGATWDGARVEIDTSTGRVIRVLRPPTRD